MSSTCTGGSACSEINTANGLIYTNVRYYTTSHNLAGGCLGVLDGCPGCNECFAGCPSSSGLCGTDDFCNCGGCNCYSLCFVGNSATGQFDIPFGTFIYGYTGAGFTVADSGAWTLTGLAPTLVSTGDPYAYTVTVTLGLIFNNGPNQDPSESVPQFTRNKQAAVPAHPHF